VHTWPGCDGRAVFDCETRSRLLELLRCSRSARTLFRYALTILAAFMRWVMLTGVAMIRLMCSSG
jgi:hypothetical protein